jgi:hypothetical protein
MLTETAQKIIQEEVTDILPRMDRIKQAGRSGGPNLEVFIKTRCEQITKLLKEIEGKT